MRIALINENSQAGKNEIIYRELKGVVGTNGTCSRQLRHVFRR